MMTDFSLLIDFHKDAERQGPGSPEDTLKALSFIEIPPGSTLKVADIGCGSGGPTLVLAQHLEGAITGVDLFPEFLEALSSRAEKAGLQDRITPMEASMDKLPFAREELDIIWSEGAIYNLGFGAGVRYWKQFLKPGGYLALSEVTWLTASRPQEIEDFWNREYPEIDTASGKMKVLEQHGFSPVGYFVLPPDSWIEHYFKPQEAIFSAFLERHHHSDEAKAVVEDHQAEIRLYHRFKDYYSYGFYIARKG